MNSSPKINVLGRYVSLGGEVLPADNALKSSSIPQYDPRLDGVEIPSEVYQAAALLIDYFKRQGHKNWQFMGLQPVKPK